LVAKIPPQLLLLRRLNLQSSWELAQEQQEELHQQQSGAGIPAALCVVFNYHGVTALITKLQQRFQFYLVLPSFTTLRPRPSFVLIFYPFSLSETENLPLFTTQFFPSKISFRS
jgi:hypothetical protein